MNVFSSSISPEGGAQYLVSCKSACSLKKSKDLELFIPVPVKNDLRRPSLDSDSKGKDKR